MHTAAANSALRVHALNALCRARALPIGSSDRNDQRQLAIGLRWLERNGSDAAKARMADGLAHGTIEPSSQ